MTSLSSNGGGGMVGAGGGTLEFPLRYFGWWLSGGVWDGGGYPSTFSGFPVPPDSLTSEDGPSIFVVEWESLPFPIKLRKTH